MGVSEPEKFDEKKFLETAPRRQRRAYLKLKQGKKNEWPFPDFMKGLSNHDRMMLKKISRTNTETKSRARRNNQRNSK